MDPELDRWAVDGLDHEGPEDAVAGHDFVTRYVGALADAIDRTIVESVVQGYTHAEIATRTNLSPEAVNSRIHRLRHGSGIVGAVWDRFVQTAWSGPSGAPERP
nr:sigma factor-like helix-turn-helix DNA-binding protein [Streptomyces sp. SID3343]